MSESNESLEQKIIELKLQLTTARSEIKNLRQQVQSLKHSVKNDVQEIQDSIKQPKCSRCENIQNATTTSNSSNDFPVIGVINTWFAEKRGIPRQAGLCSQSKGVLQLDQSVINNTGYALEGLEEFSHLWILFHFHKNDSNHVRTKVAPPRLNGIKIGVFSTRSPHRPCPIGLSLVQIDKISGLKIYFSGVDMLDGTPVLDIKPYIPLYDDPSYLARRTSLLEIDADEREIVGESNQDVHKTRRDELERQVEGGVSDDEVNTAQVNTLSTSRNIPATSNNTGTFRQGMSRDEALAEGREAPDGEEEVTTAAAANVQTTQSFVVRVPNWINNPPTSKLNVVFDERALVHIKNTPNSDLLKNTIISVLKEDPRSIYLRKKLGSQFYTFLIQDLHVSCKFDDSNHIVTIYQIKSASDLCECGVQRWQCQQHSA